MILICRFSETIPIAIGWEVVSSSYKLQLYLQQPSLSPSPHLPISPTPQVPMQVQEAGKLRMPWCHWSPLVLHHQPGPHSFMLSHRVNRLLSVVPQHRRADRSCGSSTLEAH